MRWVKACRIRSGDKHHFNHALEQLHQAIKIELHMYVVSRVKPSDVKDVLQEIWKAIVTNIRSFRGNTDKQFLKWCYVIAMRKAADSHSDGNRMDVLPDDELTHLIDKSCEVKPMSAQDRLDLKHAMNLLEKSKPECREFLWSHFVIGFDISEIAKEYNLNYDAARMKINRCLKMAQGLL